MTDFDEHIPEDLRDIAERLTEARAGFTPLELDELRTRVHRRVSRPARRRGMGAFRRTSLAAILAAALMLSSGAGAVIAAGYFGGGSQVFQTTSFRHDRDASYCQYHGPVTITRVIPTFFGLLIVTITFDCGRVISVHINFIPFPFPHGHGHGLGFGWQFGNGPLQTTSGTSVSTTAPTGTTGMTITSNGSNYTLPFSYDH